MAEYESAVTIEEDERATRDRLLLDAGVGAWRFDPDTDLYTFAKELMRNFAGMSPAVPRAMVEAICHPDDLVIERPLRERITTKGGSGEMELRMRLPGAAAWKHQRIILRSGRQLPSGRFEMYGLTLDVTESAAARNEARARNEQLGLALRAAQGGVFSIDFQRGVFLSSPEFVDIAGADIARGEGLQGVWPMIHPDDVPRMQAMAGRWGEPGWTSIDVRTTARQGGPWIRVYCDIVRDADGGAHRGVGLVLEIVVM
jgi:PAS domain-containing protein